MAKYHDELRMETRLTILETAIDMFGRDGYEHVTVDQIVQRVGVAKGTFFLYFPTKGAVLEYWLMTWLDTLRRSVEIEEGADLLSNLLRVVDKMAQTNQGQLKLLEIGRAHV